MNPPVISVLLPAYNCETYLAIAVRSVLDQTYTDFELIIINDGSTDKTETIINSFSDSRIVYHKNESNRGLIFTLNKAIDLAKGKFMARMDADDICRPDRLELQKRFLDEHPETGLVASTITLMDEKNDETGYWPLDMKILTGQAIRATMPKENCIAHPSVMGRSSIFRQFKYKPYQRNIEDYDLWLRLLSSNIRIDKIKESLLLYRSHQSSVTTKYLKKKNFFFLHFKMKSKFIWNEWKQAHFNAFVWIVFFSTLGDMAKAVGKEIKALLRK